MNEVHGLTEVLRSQVNSAERDIDYFLGQLESLNEHGFAPESLSMVRLENDAKTLHQLASRIETIRSKLIAW
jgi:hypothetical protein